MLKNFSNAVIRILSDFLPKSVFDLLFRYRSIVKFVISGGTAATVDLFFLFLLTDIFGVWYLVSAIIAFLIAFCVSFVLQKYWTFSDDSRDNIKQQLAVYLAISLFCNLVLNTILMYVFVDLLHIWYMLSQVITSLIIALGTYFIYRDFVFKKKENNA